MKVSRNADDSVTSEPSVDTDDLARRIVLLEQIGHLGTWSLDFDSMNLEVSDWVRRNFDIDAVLPLNDFLVQVGHPDDRDELGEVFLTAVAERMPFTATSCLQNRVTGVTIWVRVTGDPRLGRDNTIDGMVGVVQRVDQEIRNREERTRYEETLQRVQRDESASYIASGLAHEISNLLQPALMRCEMAQMAVERGETNDIAPALIQIRSVIQRTAEVVNATLEFARLDSETLEPIRVNAMISDIEHFIDSRLLNRVTMTTPDHVLLLAFLGTRHGIGQIVVNLLNNAAAVAGKDSPIAIAIRQVTDPRRSTSVLEMTFEDSGPGFSDEALARAFDPLFTTRFGSKGTGLGLPVVRTMIERWSGSITIANRPEGGAKVTLRLPLLDAESE